MTFTPEEGQAVLDDGRIVYDWPPRGRFADIWSRVVAVTTEEERSHLISLLHRELDENSTLAAYTDDEGHWVDVEPDWSTPAAWMREPPA